MTKPKKTMIVCTVVNRYGSFFLNIETFWKMFDVKVCFAFIKRINIRKQSLQHVLFCIVSGSFSEASGGGAMDL